MTGPSGSGKTTLLTLIGTLRTVQEGSVNVLGNELHGATAEQRIAVRRKLGFIFQHHNLFASLTALENVRMGLELFQPRGPQVRPPCHRHSHPARAGKSVSLQARESFRRPKAAHCHRAVLAHGPRLVLADEPTAALDGNRAVKSLRSSRSLLEHKNARSSWLRMTTASSTSPTELSTWSMAGSYRACWCRSRRLICDFLAHCPLFAPLTPRTLSYVADHMKLEVFSPGAVVTRQGDPGDKFYMIRSGSVDVVREEKAGRRTVNVLRRGDFFGETAPVDRGAGNATVVAAEKVEVYALGKTDFDAVIMASAPLEEELRKALFARQ